jgi:DNA-binding NtrC family response regulator
LTTIGTGENLIAPADADDALVRRIVDAAVLPDLLGRETVVALLDATAAEAAVIYEQRPSGELRVVACAGVTDSVALTLVQSVTAERPLHRAVLSEPLGRHDGGTLVALIAASRPIGYPAARRFRMIVSVARQGFALCAARDHSALTAEPDPARSLEPLLPGFLAAGAAMTALVEKIQRLQGNDLTVLITGESGTGKELVARAIHVGSHRGGAILLPYNCTTTGRDLADSQLFGHRRGAFTGAISDQPGLIRAASGGTLFLDEIGDLPPDVQPKLLRFLEQSEIMPVGDTSPQRVDVRVLAATNADLEQRVAEGKFREDLYYRLSVIRIHVPPLRDRRDEIPHLTMYFLREAGETLGKPGVRMSSEALAVFAQYWWPGNVRQLRNEMHRIVALARPDDAIGVAHLSPEITATQLPDGRRGTRRSRPAETTLASAVEQVERDVIQAAIDRSSGNISAAARALGITRRGLYLKLQRLGIGAVEPED